MNKFVQPEKPTKQPKRQPTKLKKQLFIGVCALVLGAAGLTTYDIFNNKESSQDTPSKQEQTTNGSKFNNKGKGTQKQTVSSQTPYIPIVASRTQEQLEKGYDSGFLELNLNANVTDKLEDLVIVYTDTLDFYTDVLIGQEKQIAIPESLNPYYSADFEEDEEETQVFITGMFEGYAAYKDEEGNWQRIRSVKPNPDIEVKYTDKGGRSSKEEIIKANKKAEADAKALLDKALPKMIGETKLDFSSAEAAILRNVEGGPESKEALETLNKVVKEQGPSVRQPYTLYTRESWSNRINEDGYEAIGVEQAMSQDGETYFTLLEKETVKAINKGYEEEVKALMDTEGVPVFTTLYVTSTTVTINGVRHKAEDVIIDVDQPNLSAEYSIRDYTEGFKRINKNINFRPHYQEGVQSKWETDTQPESE